MTRLQQLYDEQGQSPWLDNLRRGWITSGELQAWVERGVRGITSNPSIFQKAMGSGDDYDEQLRELAGTSIDDAYWSLVIKDIEDALAILRPVYDASDGDDGYVSVEVAPALARDTEGTIAAARELHERIAEPNLYVKIPGTAAGIPAIQQMISEGRSINITLIFSLDRYEEVIEAYLSRAGGLRGRPVRRQQRGLVLREPGRHRGRPPPRGDRHARGAGPAGQGRGRPGPGGLRPVPGDVPGRALGRARRPGRQGPASAVGVDLDQERGVPRHPLRRRADRPGHGQHHARGHDRGVRGPRHARPHRSTPDPAAAHAVLEPPSRVGVDLDDVGRRLEDEGVAAFAKSFDELLGTLGAKAEELGAA